MIMRSLMPNANAFYIASISRLASGFGMDLSPSRLDTDVPKPHPVRPYKLKQITVLNNYCNGRPLWIQQTKKTIRLYAYLGVEFIIHPWC